MSEDEAAVYYLCDELHRNQSVSDATYARALSRFGEQGIIDIVGVNGGYSLLAMVMNTARTPRRRCPRRCLLWLHFHSEWVPAPQ